MGWIKTRGPCYNPPSAMNIRGLWQVTTLSFVVALSGALMPGPLFTYTVAKSVQSRRRGFLVGLWVTLGHAGIEALLITGLLAGLAALLGNRLVMRVVGALGSALLLYMGVGLLREAFRRRVPEEAAWSTSPASGLQRLPAVLGGAVISMSNPYWWIWWATVGSALMAQFGVGWSSWPLLVAFFLGHEAGDLAWYLTVSSLLHWGKRRLPPRLYLVLYGACGIFIMAFAVYLVLSLARR
jgi:threonine/homoserine/homoserine lactone efflux protein